MAKNTAQTVCSEECWRNQD